MLRNREIQKFLLTMIVVSLLAIVIASFISETTMWFVIIMTSIFLGTTYFYTRWRYKEIEKLSNYLRRISAGDFSLDVRDNNEGELSILKNEIYKVTNMLSKQGEHLQADKIHLTNAISDISHQLKTPLTSMMVMTDLLAQENLPSDKRREFANHIHVQLERLDWLVSALLKLSKIDAGTVEFQKDKMAVKEVIDHAIKSVSVPIDIKEQTIQINGHEDTFFIGDFHWCVEALTNIIKNCVEHTPKGGQITISFTENVLFTEIMISDTGQGITKKDLPYIFQRFYKGEHAGEDSVGIGLAMAYSIIKNQNGDIEVTSEQGQGTTFHIKFYKTKHVAS